MHAIKCGFSSQTLALAKTNDEVEKKRGVRLSKKERRVMVESFIKIYQSSNNGNFPSIHVTHKEVGGSYYIVREIVRDIIQENKVLGPPRLLQKASKMFDSIPGDDYPLGSISMEPPVSSASLPKSLHESDDGGPNGDGIPDNEKLADQSIDDNNIYIGQNAPDGKLDEGFHEEPEATESLLRGYQDCEKSKLEETIEQTEPSAGLVSELSNAVSVEIPLDSSVKLSESLDTISKGEVSLSSVTPESVAGHADEGSVSHIVCVEDQKAGTSKLGETTLEHHVNKSSENSCGTFNYISTEEGIEADIDGCDNQKVIISHSRAAPGVMEQVQEYAASETGAVASTTRIDETLNGTRIESIVKPDENGATKANQEAVQSLANGKSDDILKSSEQDPTRAKSEAIHSSSSTSHYTDSKPTLDRINLESWEGASRKSARQDSPFSSFVKACVTAFSKIWSK